MVGEKYLAALADVAGGLPWMLPLFGDGPQLTAMLDRVDAVFLTGSYSNVLPEYYGGDPSEAGTLHDAERDATTLPLVRHAVQRGMPIFAVCRGFQEVNVALGGSLHQRVHEVDGYDYHLEDPSAPLDVQYGPAHDVHFEPNSRLAEILGRNQITVNSLHAQGVDRLANGLQVEGRAEDGLIEAVSIVDHPGFAFAVQWHPEWRAAENPDSATMFRSFGDAARQFAAERPRRRQTRTLLDDLGSTGEP